MLGLSAVQRRRRLRKRQFKAESTRIRFCLKADIFFSGIAYWLIGAASNLLILFLSSCQMLEIFSGVEFYLKDRVSVQEKKKEVVPFRSRPPQNLKLGTFPL